MATKNVHSVPIDGRCVAETRARSLLVVDVLQARDVPFKGAVKRIVSITTRLETYGIPRK